MREEERGKKKRRKDMKERKGGKITERKPETRRGERKEEI